MTTYQPNTNDSRNEFFSTTKRVCFFIGNKLTLAEKSNINVNELIISDLGDLVPEDILSDGNTDYEIWEDKDITTLENTTYIFDKFYVLTDMFLSGPYDSCINSFNTTSLSNINDLNDTQRVKRENRLRNLNTKEDLNEKSTKKIKV